MTTYYLGLNKGQSQNPGNVTIGTSAPASDIYLAWVSTNAPTRKDILLAMCTFTQYLEGNWIPGSANPGADLPPL